MEKSIEPERIIHVIVYRLSKSISSLLRITQLWEIPNYNCSKDISNIFNRTKHDTTDAACNGSKNTRSAHV